jgi:hypothetical protein
MAVPVNWDSLCLAKSRAGEAIDDGVAENPVEPRHRALLAAERELLQAARDRVLQDVLRQLAASYPPLEEGEKRAAVFDEGRDEIVA